MRTFLVMSPDLPGTIRLSNLPNLSVAEEVMMRLMSPDSGFSVAHENHDVGYVHLINWPRVRWVHLCEEGEHVHDPQPPVVCDWAVDLEQFRTDSTSQG